VKRLRGIVTQSQRLGDFYHKQNGLGYLQQYGGEQFAIALLSSDSFKNFTGGISMQTHTFSHGGNR
jgi:hypothetical protein